MNGKGYLESTSNFLCSILKINLENENHNKIILFLDAFINGLNTGCRPCLI